MEAGCATAARKVALGFEPLTLFVIRFRLFSSAALLMLYGGEMKVRVVGWVRVRASGGKERECRGCHDGDLGSRVEWHNSYDDSSLKRTLQHDSCGGGLAAACAWWRCKAVAAMEDDGVVVYSIFYIQI
ncbi:hypothetical protein LR48_Vigan03g091300 [Vigna angularis]|uniref:Uncharacterized protein n=1 Tax=Phaseolus angularis TaxID=3914 RepID=A0A0L9U438_PHAAN|nr:hypothetical protein LR48_Vigan03g091300 [Vigna angularis]